MLRAIGLGPHLRLHGGNVLNHRVVTVLPIPKGIVAFCFGKRVSSARPIDSPSTALVMEIEKRAGRYQKVVCCGRLSKRASGWGGT